MTTWLLLLSQQPMRWMFFKVCANAVEGQTNTPLQTMHAVVGFTLLFIGFGFVFQWNVNAQSKLSSQAGGTSLDYRLFWPRRGNLAMMAVEIDSSGTDVAYFCT